MRAPTGPTARLFDPDTSRAAVPSPARLTALQEAVWRAHRSHASGLTDDELCGVLDGEYPPSVKKRRTELAHAGLLVDSGVRRPTRRGRAAVVWVIAG